MWGNDANQFAHSMVSMCLILQELALDILYYVQELHESTMRTLALLCLSPAYPPSLAQRAISIVQHAANAGRVAPDLYLSFLASLLVGRTSAVGADLLDPGYARAQQVVSSASRALASFPGGSGAPVFPARYFISTLCLRIPCCAFSENLIHTDSKCLHAVSHQMGGF